MNKDVRKSEGLAGGSLPSDQAGAPGPIPESTSVGIVGAGPAGLMLSHLLSRIGVPNVVLESRSYDDIARTHRAGILEQPSVDLLVDSGVSGRVETEGDKHSGIQLRFNGVSHMLDFTKLVDSSVTLYAQTEIFIDLVQALRRDGGNLHFNTPVLDVTNITGNSAMIHFDSEKNDVKQNDDGDLNAPRHLKCDFVIGADGSRSLCRKILAQSQHQTSYSGTYPYAWFGIFVEAPKSAPELVYTKSERGFALISQRTPGVQRMYFQCDPSEQPEKWSDNRIWDELQTRVQGPDGFTLIEGPITEKSVLPFRSYVREPMSHGRLFLAGDAAHTVPPTGAKGLNLAFADVRVLFEALDLYYSHGSREFIDSYSQHALDRVWKAQYFSSWMSSLLHRSEDPFIDKRNLSELQYIVETDYGQKFLAESYTGWPSSTSNVKELWWN